MNALSVARGFDKGSLEKNPLLQHWLGFESPGLVHVRTGKVEIGQGIGTALSQIAADALGVHRERIRIQPVNTEHSPNEGVTSGSFSIEHSGDAVRHACATLRQMASERYAALHGISAGSVSVADGVFTSPETTSSDTYWTLDLSQILSEPVDGLSEKQVPRQWVGRSALRDDLRRKILGEPVFIQDLTFDGMMHGRVIRAANRFATLQSLEPSVLVNRFSGAEVVRDGSFLAVLSLDEAQSVAAARTLAATVEWDFPVQLPNVGELNHYLRQAPSERRVVAERRSAGHDSTTDGLSRLAASYSRPYLAHASVGPSCAIAWLRGNLLEVWCHSQGIFNLQTELLVYLRRIDEHTNTKVVVHHHEGAGCYGHNPGDDVAFDAALLALKRPGSPVRVLWSRSDELSCGPLGPAHLVDLCASVTESGVVQGFEMELWSNGYTCRPGRADPNTSSLLAAGSLADPIEHPVSLDHPPSVGGGADRNAIPEYEFPELRVIANRLTEMPLRASALRALGGFTNIWAIESFVDEIAGFTGKDPIELRLSMLRDERSRAVIEAAIAAAPWWEEERPEGVGHGFAFARYKGKGAWCAVAARILAGKTIRVLDLVVAADVGLIVHPDGVKNQLEGGAIQSCSWTLKEQVPFSSTEVTARSWEDYPILSFSEAPRVVVSLIDRPNEPSLGAGEAAQGPTAAAIGNAVFDALGVRIRDLPITPERIITAISAA